MVRVEPLREGTVRFPDPPEAPGVLDDRGDLEAIADDAGVGHQSPPLAGPERRDGVGVESREGAAEVLALDEHGEPGEAGLVDLEGEPLEKGRLGADGKSVLAVVVRTVERVPLRGTAVGHARSPV
jgi:hypothetical protein